MKYFRIITLFLLSAVSLQLTAQSVDIIPRPLSVEMKEGYFVLNEKTTIYYNDKLLEFLADYTSKTIKSLADVQLRTLSFNGLKSNSKSINLILDNNTDAAREGYNLIVTSKEIIIRAITPQGLFYGVQSLQQLIPVNGERKIAALMIEDRPRFPWRGLMLDVSRHFFTIDEVKRLIDEMVIYKFNILHLHLTDDQGWRLEIKKLPELTKVGAWRVPRTGLWWNRERPKESEEATYGGYYTQEQIKDLVKYAGERFVNILPEIDVPGHSLAAIAAYPYLSSSKLIYKVNPGSKFYGIDDNSLCAGKESTY